MQSNVILVAEIEIFKQINKLFNSNLLASKQTQHDYFKTGVQADCLSTYTTRKTDRLSNKSS